MSIRAELASRWSGVEAPFLIDRDRALHFSELLDQNLSHLREVEPGDSVAVIGEFDASTIATMLWLIDRKAIVTPLSADTKGSHTYFFESAKVKWVVENSKLRRFRQPDSHPLITELRQAQHSGLVLFTSGSTGAPKAILHDMDLFLRRFFTPRPTMVTLAFLLFDHIGGINTVLHALFNRGSVVSPSKRSVGDVLDTCRKHGVEVLPTTPTFLRMMLFSGIREEFPPSLKLVTYGTESMDQETLSQLCSIFPDVDFRQTYGMSELGILRVKSRSRDSLWMKIGGEGVKTRVRADELQVFSPTRMRGYLNAESPFDEEGWYSTGDMVEQDGEYYRIIGRKTQRVNVAGLKFFLVDVENCAQAIPGVAFSKAVARQNPITGEHVEITLQALPGAELDVEKVRREFESRLPSHMRPRKITIGTVTISHRLKRL